MLLSNLSKDLKAFGTHFEAPDDESDLMIGQQIKMGTETEEEIEAEATMDQEMFMESEKEH